MRNRDVVEPSVFGCVVELGFDQPVAQETKSTIGDVSASGKVVAVGFGTTARLSWRLAVGLSSVSGNPPTQHTTRQTF